MTTLTTTIIDRIFDKLGHHTHKHDKLRWTGPEFAPIYGVSVCRCGQMTDYLKLLNSQAFDVVWSSEYRTIRRMEAAHNRALNKRGSDPDYEEFVPLQAGAEDIS